MQPEDFLFEWTNSNQHIRPVHKLVSSFLASALHPAQSQEGCHAQWPPGFSSRLVRSQMKHIFDGPIVPARIIDIPSSIDSDPSTTSPPAHQGRWWLGSGLVPSDYPDLSDKQGSGAVQDPTDDTGDVDGMSTGWKSNRGGLTSEDITDQSREGLPRYEHLREGAASGSSSDMEPAEPGMRAPQDYGTGPMGLPEAEIVPTGSVASCRQVVQALVSCTASQGSLWVWGSTRQVRGWMPINKVAREWRWAVRNKVCKQVVIYKAVCSAQCASYSPLNTRILTDPHWYPICVGTAWTLSACGRGTLYKR